MKEKYKNQPIIAAEWPPRVDGHDFFGRLALVEKKKDPIAAQKAEHQESSAWHLLRGQVDKISELSEHQEINLRSLLQSERLSLRVVVDGPPGIGKTTLCRKLLNMWANKTLIHQQYELVLYCPLRNSKIAKATTLVDLFERQRHEVPMVAEWFEKRNGEGLLIIFDGWDELSTELKKSSLVTNIICRDALDLCSVIVTSRSYASYSLLQMPSLQEQCKHVQVLGFSQKELSTVIIRTLQKDPNLAQKLIDENKEEQSFFKTTQDNDESQLAIKLINDLKVRGDVQSLCYIPLVCSMVILIHCKEGHLLTTLTQMYENFILQTIRRHVKRHDDNPNTLGSLSSLPSQLAEPLQQICQVAYTGLKEVKMSFFSHELQEQSLVKEDYLGLMATFTEYDDEKYQFLHLSIQEFLAAWWIAKHEKNSEDIFKDEFDNEHFRMCLRFVAGLTHLEHEGYQEHFSKRKLDVECKRRLSIGFEYHIDPWFFKCPEIRECKISKLSEFDHLSSKEIKRNFPDDFPTFLLQIQLLYESQNTKLCQVLAESIIHLAICSDRMKTQEIGKSGFSPFDALCLSYFIKNSNVTWNCLHLNMAELSVFIDGLANSSLQTLCRILIMDLDESTNDFIDKALCPSLIQNIQECYFIIHCGKVTPCLMLLHLVKLPQVKTLHTIIKSNEKTIEVAEAYSQLQKSIETNSTIQELVVAYGGQSNETKTITCVIQGITKNKEIKSFSLFIPKKGPHEKYEPDTPLPDGIIEQLLKENNTIKSLILDIRDDLLPLSFKTAEVSMSLTALRMGCKTVQKASFPKDIKVLVLSVSQSPCHLFDSCPFLQALHLPLDTAEKANKLFNILQTNTTLKALSVHMENMDYSGLCAASLQNMLAKNHTLCCFEIDRSVPSTSEFSEIPSTFMSSLTTGLKNNKGITRLSIPVFLPIDEDTKALFDVVSLKFNLTELQLKFFRCYNIYKVLSLMHRMPDFNSFAFLFEMGWIHSELFFHQGLPAVTKILKSLITIKILRIQCLDVHDMCVGKPEALFHNEIIKHPSLLYVEMDIDEILCTVPNWKDEHFDRFKNNPIVLFRKMMCPSRAPFPIVEYFYRLYRASGIKEPAETF